MNEKFMKLNKKSKNKKKYNLKLLYKTIYSIQKNLKSWVFLFIAVYFISEKSNFQKGLATMFILIFSAYWGHKMAHLKRDWFRISHIYHHENDNFFSNFIQIILELLCALTTIYVNYFLLDNKLDKWIIIFMYIFYTTIHNINYSILKVNKTHKLHHDNINTNFGPDICDILFNTKNKNIKKKYYIEDTDHYIPNIIIISIIMLILKKINEIYNVNHFFYQSSIILYLISAIILIISNTYLIYFYD